jgi:hypothetical protein
MDCAALGRGRGHGGVMSAQGKPARCFVIVENAGYERETTLPGTFPNSMKAWQRAQRIYRPAEQFELHVDVALQLEDGTLTYDF